MIIESKSNIRLRMVTLARLYDLRAILLERFCGLLRGTDDGNVPGHVSIGILI